jgi:hypothetical protein
MAGGRPISTHCIWQKRAPPALLTAAVQRHGDSSVCARAPPRPRHGSVGKRVCYPCSVLPLLMANRLRRRWCCLCAFPRPWLVAPTGAAAVPLVEFSSHASCALEPLPSCFQRSRTSSVLPSKVCLRRGQTRGAQGPWSRASHASQLSAQSREQSSSRPMLGRSPPRRRMSLLPLSPTSPQSFYSCSHLPLP